MKCRQKINYSYLYIFLQIKDLTESSWISWTWPALSVKEKKKWINRIQKLLYTRTINLLRKNNLKTYLLQNSFKIGKNIQYNSHQNSKDVFSTRKKILILYWNKQTTYEQSSPKKKNTARDIILDLKTYYKAFL